MATNNNSTTIKVPYFQSNQLITDGAGRITPQFTTNLNNTLGNIQYQLTEIESLFSALNTTNGNISDLEDNLNNFQDTIKNFTTDMAYLKGFSSYVTGLSLACDLNMTISVSQHTRHFMDGTSITYNGTTWDNQTAATTYYVYMDNDGTYHHTTEIDDMIQTADRYCLGRIVTPATTAKTGTLGSNSLTLGQLFAS